MIRPQAARRPQTARRAARRYNAPMHFRHRQTDRQTDTDIVAIARDVYITSRAKMSHTM